MIEKTRNAPEECMAGAWPPGAVKGKSYKENGNLVTDACADVAGLSDLVGGFFDNEQLWRMPSSLDTGERFAKAFESAFSASSFQKLPSLWSPPRPVDPLMARAFNYYRGFAQEITESKQTAGRLASEQSVVHEVVSRTIYWPLLLATAFALRLGKARLDLAAARRVTAPESESASMTLEPSLDVNSKKCLP